MIEVATDEQKSVIVDTVGPELVNISLNMHGTRAVQKLIENLTLPAHVRCSFHCTVKILSNHCLVSRSAPPSIA
jgi:hypothetical protein